MLPLSPLDPLSSTSICAGYERSTAIALMAAALTNRHTGDLQQQREQLLLATNLQRQQRPDINKSLLAASTGGTAATASPPSSATATTGTFPVSPISEALMELRTQVGSMRPQGRFLQRQLKTEQQQQNILSILECRGDLLLEGLDHERSARQVESPSEIMAIRSSVKKAIAAVPLENMPSSSSMKHEGAFLVASSDMSATSESLTAGASTFPARAGHLSSSEVKPPHDRMQMDPECEEITSTKHVIADEGEEESNDDRLPHAPLRKENGRKSVDDHPDQDTFPFKLYRLLDQAKQSGQDHIISFLPEGRSFAIHQAKAFVHDIMPHYFTTHRMSSFQRQLNLYGFKRISAGPGKGAYQHPFFIEGQKELCLKIRRKKSAIKPSPPMYLSSTGDLNDTTNSSVANLFPTTNAEAMMLRPGPETSTTVRQILASSSPATWLTTLMPSETQAQAHSAWHNQSGFPLIGRNGVPSSLLNSLASSVLHRRHCRLQEQLLQQQQEALQQLNFLSHLLASRSRP